MTKNKNTCIVIVGPTAVGKTSLALALARHFHTDIISADSRQCYREISIGVAKPTADELNSVKHYFINSHSIAETLTAADFENYALSASKEIFNQNNIAVMVGGTGLYVNAFCQGLDAIPAIDAVIRQQIRTGYENYGIKWLQEAIAKNDPVYFSNGEIQNPQRVMRALEVVLSTGNSIRYYQQGNKAARNFNCIKIGLNLPKPLLHENINKRVDGMLQEGLVEEVKQVLAYRNHNALLTVGYKEIFAFFDGEYDLLTAIEKIKINTRQYAKRQITWFKKDAEIEWFNPSELQLILKYLSGRLVELR
ncbi:MAG: tRNA (adenosine(37)-N6)-dimethylallyltransferase MiaA [Flavihumibacter sp.]|nr:tRNA (adenosine(37)-N6)-dimethylallyltransferase MiaA [Flavihumibacter sp.]